MYEFRMRHCMCSWLWLSRLEKRLLLIIVISGKRRREQKVISVDVVGLGVTREVGLSISKGMAMQGEGNKQNVNEDFVECLFYCIYVYSVINDVDGICQVLMLMSDVGDGGNNRLYKVPLLYEIWEYRWKLPKDMKETCMHVFHKNKNLNMWKLIILINWKDIKTSINKMLYLL